MIIPRHDRGQLSCNDQSGSDGLFNGSGSDPIHTLVLHMILLEIQDRKISGWDFDIKKRI